MAWVRDLVLHGGQGGLLHAEAEMLFLSLQQCPGAVNSDNIRKVWFKTLKLSFFKKEIYTVGTR